MSYIVLEIQASEEGAAATITTPHETREAAESAWHSALAAAAISAVPYHSAILLSDRGEYIAAQTYEHETEAV